MHLRYGELASRVAMEDQRAAGVVDVPPGIDMGVVGHRRRIAIAVDLSSLDFRAPLLLEMGTEALPERLPAVEPGRRGDTVDRGFGIEIVEKTIVSAVIRLNELIEERMDVLVSDVAVARLGVWHDSLLPWRFEAARRRAGTTPTGIRQQ